MSAILGVDVSSLCFYRNFWIILSNSNHRRCIGNCQFSYILHLCVRSMVSTKLFCVDQIKSVEYSKERPLTSRIMIVFLFNLIFTLK